jgi:RNA polymerase sigma-70 factor (ECF subfamily)
MTAICDEPRLEAITNDHVSMDSANGNSPKFQQTQWSLVRRAGDAHSPEAGAALETLCRAYWFPIYAFIRRRGHSPHDAQDLTQGFFMRLLEGNTIERANPRLGKFRTFLLTVLKRFLSDAHRRATAWKRGGSIQTISFEDAQAEERYRLEPVDNRTPDKIFEEQWTVALLETAMLRLEEEFRAAGKERQFQVLKPFLSHEATNGDYEEAAAELLTSAKTLAVAVHRIRRRFRLVVRSVIADTVSAPDQVEEEYRSLFA